ncbi:hypothetical protein LTR08_007425 [Meristemomyces frigidus]|nr:hypothetical protein LTR08_007425 [Meristemomyces frigidus]
MGAIFYPLLAISALLSGVSGLPYQKQSPAQQLQSKQPTLDGLPSNSNLTLQHVGLGAGTQNYTCNGTAWVQTGAGDGAFATLYDAASLLAASTTSISSLPSGRLAQYKRVKECQELANLLPQLSILGNHYFDANNRATFNLSQANPPLVLSAAKLDSVQAPVADAISWLYLVDANDSISRGLKAVYRVETAGGVAPSSCTSAQMGSSTFIPYAAEYWFYD